MLYKVCALLIIFVICPTPRNAYLSKKVIFISLPKVTDASQSNTTSSVVIVVRVDVVTARMDTIKTQENRSLTALSFLLKILNYSHYEGYCNPTFI